MYCDRVQWSINDCHLLIINLATSFDIPIASLTCAQTDYLELCVHTPYEQLLKSTSPPSLSVAESGIVQWEAKFSNISVVRALNLCYLCIYNYKCKKIIVTNFFKMGITIISWYLYLNFQILHFNCSTLF